MDIPLSMLGLIKTRFFLTYCIMPINHTNFWKRLKAICINIGHHMFLLRMKPRKKQIPRVILREREGRRKLKMLPKMAPSWKMRFRPIL